jgi:hypothetical protein
MWYIDGPPYAWQGGTPLSYIGHFEGIHRTNRLDDRAIHCIACDKGFGIIVLFGRRYR